MFFKWLFFFLACFVLNHSWCLEGEPLGDGIYVYRYSQENPKSPSIAIATVIIDNDDNEPSVSEVSYKEIVSFGTRSKHLYAKKHGYDLFVATQKIQSCYGIKAVRPLEAAWTKLALVSRILDDYDWVFWSDADSIFLNFDIQLESFLDDDYDLIACTEDRSITEAMPYCPEIGFINTGQVFYKSSPLAKKIIYFAWRYHVPYTPYSYEQARINGCIQAGRYQEFVKVHPPHDFNISANFYEKGDFLVHMYGFHGIGLLECFNAYEKKYAYILDEQEEM